MDTTNFHELEYQLVLQYQLTIPFFKKNFYIFTISRYVFWKFWVYLTKFAFLHRIVGEQVDRVEMVEGSVGKILSLHKKKTLKSIVILHDKELQINHIFNMASVRFQTYYLNVI